MLHFALTILLGVDDLNVDPGGEAARHAVPQNKTHLTHHDPVRVDLAEKANHDSVIPSVVLWHSLPYPDALPKKH